MRLRYDADQIHADNEGVSCRLREMTRDDFATFVAASIVWGEGIGVQELKELKTALPLLEEGECGGDAHSLFVDKLESVIAMQG